MTVCNTCRLLISLFLLLTLSPAGAQSETDSVIRYLDPEGRYNGIILYQRKGEPPVFISRGYRDPLHKDRPLLAEDRFNIASVSKSFTALGVLVLCEEYGLSPDTAIGPWFPELQPALGAVTIRQLANHRAAVHDYFSLPGIRDSLTNQEVVATLSRLDSTVYPPGQRWGYSNSGYVLLAELIRRVSGQSFENHIHTRVFTLLGMPNLIARQEVVPGLRDGELWNYPLLTQGDGDMRASAADFMKYFEREDVFRNYWKRARLLADPWKDPVWIYGFGWYFFNDAGGNFRAHSGLTEGYQAYLRIYEDGNLKFLMLSNSPDPVFNILRDGLLEHLNKTRRE